MLYIKIFFIILALFLSYLIFECEINIPLNISCEKCKRKKTKKTKENFIQVNKFKKSVSFADENNKPLKTLIRFSKTI